MMPTIGGYSNTRVKEVVKVSSSYMCQYSYHKNRIVILIYGTILEEYQGCHIGRPEAFWRTNRAGGPVHYALYEPRGVLYTEKLLFQIYFTVVTFLTISCRRGHVEDGSLRYLPTEVCRRPFDPFIYHGRSVNAHLTLIGRARRSIGRIGRAGGLGGRPAPQTTLKNISSNPHTHLYSI
jgi:hypothetical protein